MGLLALTTAHIPAIVIIHLIFPPHSVTGLPLALVMVMTCALNWSPRTPLSGNHSGVKGGSCPQAIGGGPEAKTGPVSMIEGTGAGPGAVLGAETGPGLATTNAAVGVMIEIKTGGRGG
jgi:hypothetical protein